MIAALVLALGFAAEAGAAYKAVDPEEIAKAEIVYEARPYVSPTGEQLVAWREIGNGYARVAVRSRNGGGFGPLEELSTDTNAGTPEIAFNAEGGAFAIWPINTTSVLAQSALRPPGGPFGAPRQQGPGGCSHALSVGFSKQGKLALACSTYKSTAPNYQVAYGVADDLRFIVPGNYLGTHNNDSHQRTALAWGDDGTLAVAYKQEPALDSQVINVVIRNPDGSSPGPQEVKSMSGSQLDMAGLAVLPDGTVAIAYGGEGLLPTLHLRAPGSAPVDRPLPVGEEMGTLATDASGKIHLVTRTWADPLPPTTQVVTADSAGTFSPAVTVPVPNATSYARALLVKPDGTEIALIHDMVGGGIYAAIRPAGATSFQAPIPLVGSGATNPVFALTPTGDVLATWKREVGPDDERTMVGGLDAGNPPALVVEDLPSRTLAGTPTRFAAKARDSMGIRSLTWRFGDGGVANGEVVKHSFRAPGRYSVQITATDRAGNTTSQNAVVTVVAAEGSDRKPPRLRVNGPKKIKFATLRRKGVRFRVRSNEPARLVAQIVARPRSARISAAGELILAERAVNLLKKARNLKLKPLPRLLGRPARNLRLRIRFSATDRSGNTTVVVRPLRVRR